MSSFLFSLKNRLGLETSPHTSTLNSCSDERSQSAPHLLRKALFDVFPGATCALHMDECESVSTMGVKLVPPEVYLPVCGRHLPIFPKPYRRCPFLRTARK